MILTSPLARAGMYFFPKAEPVREQVQESDQGHEHQGKDDLAADHGHGRQRRGDQRIRGMDEAKEKGAHSEHQHRTHT